MLKGQRDSHTTLAKSLPVTVPAFTSIIRRTMQEQDDDQVKFYENFLQLITHQTINKNHVTKLEVIYIIQTQCIKNFEITIFEKFDFSYGKRKIE